MQTSKYEILLFDDFYKVGNKAQILDEYGNVCFQFRDQDHFSRCGEKIMGNQSNFIKFNNISNKE